MNEIKKPIYRSPLRQYFGKEYFILKRKWQEKFGGKSFATPIDFEVANFEVYKHQSLILRPLKNVEMYLQENKRTNLALAIKKLNHTVVKPGQIFSFWHLVGRPTAGKGYLEGLVLKQGKIGKDTGGGLCQLGNLLFWIFAHSPLTITERHRHGFDVFPDVNRKVPFGAGATLSYNYIDLQVKNETQHTFKLKLWLDKTHLHGALYTKEELTSSFKIEERNHIMKQQYWGGYSRHNQILKIETTKENERKETLLVENHAVMMYTPFLRE